MASSPERPPTPTSSADTPLLAAIPRSTHKAFVEQVAKNLSLFLISIIAFVAYLLHERYVIYISEEVSRQQLSVLRDKLSDEDKKTIAGASNLVEAYAILLNQSKSISFDIQKLSSEVSKTMSDNTNLIMAKFAKEVDVVHDISIRVQDILRQFELEKLLRDGSQGGVGNKLGPEAASLLNPGAVVDQLFYADVDLNNVIVTFQSNELIEIRLCLNSFCRDIINPNFDSPINDILRKYHRSGVAGGGFELDAAGRSSASKSLHHIKITVLRYDISNRVQVNDFALEGFILVGRTKKHEHN